MDIETSQINLNSSHLTIVLYSDILISPLSNRRAIGFKVISDGKVAHYISRIEHIYNNEALFHHLLLVFFSEFMTKIRKIMTLKSIDFVSPRFYPTLIDEEYNLADLHIGFVLLKKMGIVLNFSNNELLLSPLIKLVFNSLSYHYEINDFSNKVSILSLNTDSGVDLDLIEDNINVVQLASQYEHGSAGINKVVLLLEDLIFYDKIIKEAHLQFPLEIEHLNDLIRRTAFMVYQCDAMILVTGIIDNELPTFTFPIDSWIYNLCKLINKHLFVLDTITKKWFIISESSKRELVRAKNFNIIKYKNIGFQTSLKSYAVVKKLIKKTFNELMMN